jgi:hypothetical protein
MELITKISSITITKNYICPISHFADIILLENRSINYRDSSHIWDAHLGEKHQLRQARFKIWSQIGSYLGK